MFRPLQMPPRDAEEWGLPEGADDEAANDLRARAD